MVDMGSGAFGRCMRHVEGGRDLDNAHRITEEQALARHGVAVWP